MTQRYCSNCRKMIDTSNAEAMADARLPFCSERCKLVDLGKWLDADYRIVPRNQGEDLVAYSDDSLS